MNTMYSFQILLVNIVYLYFNLVQCQDENKYGVSFKMNFDAQLGHDQNRGIFLDAEGTGHDQNRRNIGDSPESTEVEDVDGRRHGRHHGNRDPLRIRNDFPAIFEHKGQTIKQGNITDIRNSPYMAAIIINGRLWCAGTIVDENWVLTAAHCLNYVLHVSPMKSLGKYVKVRVGSPRPHEGGRLVDVVGAVRHPKFEEEPVPHADVALLKLGENLEFHSLVSHLKIYNGFAEPYAQSFVVVSGWGATRGTETAFRDHTPDLLNARLKVRTTRFCTDAYETAKGFMFTEDFFCASLRNGSRDACLFDAGAPAVQQNLVMGVMSFGPERCGDASKPAVFIKAFYFREFVQNTIIKHKSAEKLIEAIHIMDPTVTPELYTVAGQTGRTGLANIEEITKPDDRHD